MANHVYMKTEWYGSAVPSNIAIPLPTAAELVSHYKETNHHGYTLGAPYPPNSTENPMFWIKYGNTVVLNELAGQKMAYDGLRSLGSQAKAPAVYYGCQVSVSYKDDQDTWPVLRTYVVMEYVPGKTAAQCLQDSVDDDKRKDSIYTRIAFALSELHRIPVAPDSRPAAVNGGRIRHELFDDNQASLHYRNVDELEQHLNSVRRKRHDYWWLTGKLILLSIQFLFLTKSHCRVKDLAQEPMIFCYSDVWLDNFIIDEENEDHITIVDFEDASILPSSFAKFILAGTRDKIDRDIRDMVVVPCTEGVDDTATLIALAHPLMMGSGSFAQIGRKILGYYDIQENDNVEKLVTDTSGHPVSVFGTSSSTADLHTSFDPSANASASTSSIATPSISKAAYAVVEIHRTCS
jgi:hypothetical protein